MQLPFFYIEQYNPGEKIITLNEDNSRHVVQVLRMKEGEPLHLTDGKGHLVTAAIRDAHKRHCVVQITESVFSDPVQPDVTIGISLLKNNNRFEWFLEKATEIGVSAIAPLICARTEKQKSRTDRLKNILISAMLQSRQVWLPVLYQPINFNELVSHADFANIKQKNIAHCVEGEKQSLAPGLDSSIILIGPEGDFTPEEIELALKNNYKPVTLGSTRLRTETAGVVAAVRLRIN